MINGYSILIDAKYFADNYSQNHFVCQPLYRCFTTLGNSNTVTGWKFKGFSDETVKPPTTPDYILDPELTYTNDETWVTFINS